MKSKTNSGRKTTYNANNTQVSSNSSSSGRYNSCSSNDSHNNQPCESKHVEEHPSQILVLGQRDIRRDDRLSLHEKVR